MHSPHRLHSLRFPIALLLCFLLALPASAVPHLLNYQGRVAVDGQNFTGTGYFKFALIDGGANVNRTATATATVNMDTRLSAITVVDGGSGYRDQSPPAVTISGTGTGATATATVTGGVVTAITVQSGGSDYAAVPPPVVTIAPPEEDIQISTLWSNDGSSSKAQEPKAFVSLPVNRGLYAVPLGSEEIAGMQPLPPALFATQRDVRLRVWFSTNGGTFTLLTPDQRIAAVGYALMAEDIRDGSVTAAKLAPGSVTAQAIAPGAVSLQQLSPEVQSALLAVLGSQASQPPVITAGSIPATSVDAGFSWQITATGLPNSYTASGLPAGLTLNAATGIISGSPSVPGTFTLSLTATNIAGTSPVKQLTLTVSDAVYVDFAGGLDTNNGSAAQPVKTLAQGIGLASVLTPKRAVRVSTAAHALSATLQLADGVSLRGGYLPGATWTLSGTRTPITAAPNGPGNQIAVRAYRVDLLTVFNGFDVTASAPLPTSAGASSIGVSVENSAGLTITNCRITAAGGIAGSAGTNGIAGAAGTNGLNGGTIGYDTGPGGGGAGGDDGVAGSDGKPNGAAAGGHGGAPGQAVVSFPGSGLSGGTGSPGTAGSNGVHGIAGAGAAGNWTGAYLPASGSPGTSGSSGTGGGGGGGGGSSSDNHAGGAGGQGGAGGLAGTGGTGGGGGGGSFAIIARGSTLRVRDSLLITANGAAGGTGGQGEQGGAGGLQGTGANGSSGAGPFSGSGGKGGNGGAGGAGGHAGGGGGGSGGSSIGILLHSDATLAENTGNTFTLGTAGTGGTGGLFGGSTTNRAPAGSTGLRVNTHTHIP